MLYPNLMSQIANAKVIQEFKRTLHDIKKETSIRWSPWNKVTSKLYDAVTESQGIWHD